VTVSVICVYTKHHRCDSFGSSKISLHTRHNVNKDTMCFGEVAGKQEQSVVSGTILCDRVLNDSQISLEVDGEED